MNSNDDYEPVEDELYDGVYDIVSTALGPLKPLLRFVKIDEFKIVEKIVEVSQKYVEQKIQNRLTIPNTDPARIVKIDKKSGCCPTKHKERK